MKLETKYIIDGYEVEKVSGFGSYAIYSSVTEDTETCAWLFVFNVKSNDVVDKICIATQGSSNEGDHSWVSDISTCF